MRNSYKLQHDEPNAFHMTWRYDDGRTQRIAIRRYQMDAVDMVEFKSPFAELGAADPLELLRENGRLPFGAVALAGGVFLIVHNATLAELDIATFDKLLSQVASLADQLEQRHAAAADTF
jgi:hypothetical protein